MLRPPEQGGRSAILSGWDEGITEEEEEDEEGGFVVVLLVEREPKRENCGAERGGETRRE